MRDSGTMTRGRMLEAGDKPPRYNNLTRFVVVHSSFYSSTESTTESR